jgi:hypothetical protein
MHTANITFDQIPAIAIDADDQLNVYGNRKQLDHVQRIVELNGIKNGHLTI